ncbi:MAG: ABC transporter permease [Thiohalocapsa sp.]|nr:ABC transporter permease [Thiohalocapsa sp.]
MRASRETWRLAWKDLWHDRRTMAVFVLTVAAIVAPLLLLLGLKNGAITQLRETLVSDPRNLEVIIYGSARLPRAWFAEMAARDDVSFVVPKTRTINASVDVLDAERRLLPSIELLPTGPGDPLLPQGVEIPPDPHRVLVSETLAAQLGLGGGGRDADITAVIKRTLDGERQHARVPLTVIGVVPERHFARAAIFAHPALLVAAEDYRDGTLALGADTPIGADHAAAREEFANARVYARDLDAVAPLAAHLRAADIEVRTQAERIATVQALDRTFTFLFRVVAAIGGIGCALALGGALWVNADRKRRASAMLRLFGFGRLAVAALPVLQAVIVALGGLLLALAVFTVGAGVFDVVLGANLPDGGYVSRLGWGDLLMATAWMLLVAVAAAGAAAWRSARVTPAEGLRDVL